jgi:hypothetical protein
MKGTWFFAQFATTNILHIVGVFAQYATTNIRNIVGVAGYSI